MWEEWGGCDLRRGLSEGSERWKDPARAGVEMTWRCFGPQEELSWGREGGGQ